MRTARGLRPVALPVADVAASLDFYRRFADMDVVHRRRDEQTGDEVVWVSDRTRPFVVVLIEHGAGGGLTGFSHLGVGCETRAEVELRCGQARDEGRPVLRPHDSRPPVGYRAVLTVPDGHHPQP